MFNLKLRAEKTPHVLNIKYVDAAQIDNIVLILDLHHFVFGNRRRNEYIKNLQNALYRIWAWFFQYTWIPIQDSISADVIRCIIAKNVWWTSYFDKFQVTKCQNENT